MEPNHPLAELLAKKLMGIEVVSPQEQRKMVHEAIRAAVAFYEAMIGDESALQS